MTETVSDPVSALNEAVPNIISRFAFERTMYVVGRSNVDDHHDDLADCDIHNGTIVTTHGYARLARHKPTNTICLIASKASINLQGVRQTDGSILATDDGLRHSYIISAYSAKEGDEDIHAVAPKLRRALRRFGQDMGGRSEKHFTLYGASVGNADPASRWFNASTPTEVYTNGRLAYLLDKTKKGYKVTFYAPTRREDGSFVPTTLGKKTLSTYFASISKTIAVTEDYNEARDKIAGHWQKMSSKLWDEKSIFAGEGMRFRAKRSLASVFNHVVENGFQLALVTTTIGMGMSVISPKYGIMSGILAAITHTIAHQLLDESYHGTQSAIKKSREARRRLDISAYGVQDAADHFKVQTPENISKLCPKMDLDRFGASEFEFLTSEQSGMLLDHESERDGFRPSSIRAHLLSVHQRGFSSSCAVPDERSRLDIFQSGLIRMMYEKQDGKVMIFARYRADACTEESLRLPQEKLDKMGDGIMCYEYDRRRPDFHNAFIKVKADMSVDEMMKRLEDGLLFQGRDDVDPAVKAKSLHTIREAFALPEEESGLYMSGKPPVLPELAAVMR